jgi:hypothetical protein
MKPAQAFSLRSQNPTPFTSYQAARDRYQLDATDPAEVVKCVREREMRIVSNCVDAAKKGSFTFFHDTQRTYLRSLWSYPIMDFVGPEGTILPAAIAVDTDEPGFFKEDDRVTIQLFMDEFAARLKLEALMLGLLGRG